MVKYVIFFMGALALVTGQACTDQSETSGAPAASPAAATTEQPDGKTADPPKAPEKSAQKEEKESTRPPEPEKTEKAPPASESAEAPLNAEVEALKQKIAEKWNKIQSLSAKATTKEEATQGEERRATWDGTGTYDCKREGDKILVRMEVNNHMIVPEGTAVVDNYRKILTISDGQYVHNLVEAMRMRRAFKIEADRGAGFEISGPTILENLKRDNALTLLPDDMVGSRPAYVVQGIPQTGAQKLLLYLDKEYGILAKMVIEDQRRNTIRTITLGDIKINLEFPEDHFVFTPPPNVEVRDMTKAGQEKARKEMQEQKKTEGQEKGDPAPAPPPPPSP